MSIRPLHSEQIETAFIAARIENESERVIFSIPIRLWENVA